MESVSSVALSYVYNAHLRAFPILKESQSQCVPAPATCHEVRRAQQQRVLAGSELESLVERLGKKSAMVVRTCFVSLVMPVGKDSFQCVRSQG